MTNQLPAIRPGIVAVPGILSSDQVQRLLDLKKTQKPMDAKVSNAAEAVTSHKIRQSKIWWLGPEECPWLMDRLKEIVEVFNNNFFGVHIDSMEPAQLTEYAHEAGGLCTGHIDSSYVDPTIANRKLSMTIQLSDPDSYDGGDLRLYPDCLDPVVGPRTPGAMVMFRSHILHEVTPVTRGVRSSIVAWISGPPWR